MSKLETQKDERQLLQSVDAKLSALLSLTMRNDSSGLDKGSIANAANVKFLSACGVQIEDVAAILGTSKDSARKLRDRK